MTPRALGPQRASMPQCVEHDFSSARVLEEIRSVLDIFIARKAWGCKPNPIETGVFSKESPGLYVSATRWTNRAGLGCQRPLS